MATTSFRLQTLLYALPCILTSSLVAAQNGDGGAASGNLPPSSSNGNVAGASGASTGSVTISTGAIVGIALVVSVVVILGILTAVLFFVAKKRQWTVRETLRHSRRRVTTGLKTVMSPLTPHRAAFSPGPLKTKFSDKETKNMRGPHPLRKGQTNRGIGLVDVDLEALTGDTRRDLEKGEGPRVFVSEKKGPKAKPSIKIPKASKPIVQPPQTPMLNKMFGRD